MNRKKTTILIVDDHSLIRIGIRSLINLQSDMQVIGEASDGKEAVRLACELHPDVIIMDLVMPVMDGATATDEIRRLLPDTRIIVHTSFGDSSGMANAIRAGVHGAIMKDAPAERLLETIRAVTSGQTAIAPEVTAFLQNDPTPSFTDRQMEIISALARGLTNREIAKLMGITPSGVQKHLDAVFEKLGAATRAEAVAIATRKRLI